jgi:putative membrane protein
MCGCGRSPASVADVVDPEREPDYRMSLAAERTYLAYLRTALALMAAGIGVAGALPDAGGKPLRRTIGVVLVLSGGGLVVAARRRWVAVDRAMRRGEPLPRVVMLHALNWLLAGVALAAAILVFVL